MDVDRSLVDVDVVAPHTVKQLLPAEHPTGALHQEFQQLEFRGSQVKLLAGAAHPGGFAVDLKIARDEDARDVSRLGAAQQGADASQKFRYGKRLDDVVVGSCPQSP